jgi:hypothetical protein
MPGTAMAVPQTCLLGEAAGAPMPADALPLASEAAANAATMTIARR